MIASLFLAVALAPAPRPVVAAPVVAQEIAVEGRFDGRGRAHRLAARVVDGELVVTGVVTGPWPFPVARRTVVVEALAADGSVVARTEVRASGKPARGVRRRPVTREFRAELAAGEGVVGVRVWVD